MARTTQTALEDANRALASILGELKHIGWLSRRIGSEQVKKLYFISCKFNGEKFPLLKISIDFKILILIFIYTEHG